MGLEVGRQGADAGGGGALGGGGAVCRGRARYRHPPLRRSRAPHLSHLPRRLPRQSGRRRHAAPGREQGRPRLPCGCPSACRGSARISASTRSPPSFWSSSTSAAPAPASTPSATAGTRPRRGRVLPFYPAFLGRHEPRRAGRRRLHLPGRLGVHVADVLGAGDGAPPRAPRTARAGYIYLVMASFGTLALLLAFGLLAGPRRRLRLRRASASRGRPACPALVLVLVAARRRLQGRPGAAARLAAAGPSGGAQPRLRADERRDDQGRGLRLRAHRLRSGRPAGLVVEHRRARRRRHHRRAGRAQRAHAARPEAAARLQHGREHRHHLHRPGPRARLHGQRHAGGRRRWRCTAALLHVLNHSLFKSLLFFGAGAVLHRDRRARHGAARRADPPHAASPRSLFLGRLRRDLGAAAAQRLRLGVADLPGDPAEPRSCRSGA